MVARVRIASTEAIAKYRITKNGIDILRIATTNYDGRGRRYIRLDIENQEALKAILAGGAI